MSTQNSSSSRIRIISVFASCFGISPIEAAVSGKARWTEVVNETDWGWNAARKLERAEIPTISRWIRCWRVVGSYGVGLECVSETSTLEVDIVAAERVLCCGARD